MVNIALELAPRARFIIGPRERWPAAANQSRYHSGEPMPHRGLTIGQVSQRTGLSPKAIRIYERKGLLLKTSRTSAGYRLFQGHDVDVLRFIRQARSIGLSLDEIRDVLDLQRSGQKPCETVIMILDAHIADIDRA